jgi:AcrR family transcriptional regulator
LFDICTMIQPSEHIDKKEVILLQAEKLFSENDFDAVSVRDIAKEANVNIAMISYYFGSKEKLFEAVIVRRIESSINILRDKIKPDMTCYQKMERVIDYYIDKLINNRQVHRMINRELSNNNRPHLRDAIMVRMKANREYIRSIMEDGVGRGELKPDLDIDMTIMNFFGTLQYVVGSAYYSCEMFNRPTEAELFTPEFADRLKNYFKKTFKYNLL